MQVGSDPKRRARLSPPVPDLPALPQYPPLTLSPSDSPNLAPGPSPLPRPRPLRHALPPVAAGLVLDGCRAHPPTALHQPSSRLNPRTPRTRLQPGQGRPHTRRGRGPCHVEPDEQASRNDHDQGRHDERLGRQRGHGPLHRPPGTLLLSTCCSFSSGTASKRG